MPVESSNVIAYLCTYLNKCGLESKVLANRFKRIFLKSSDGSTEPSLEEEVVKTFIEEINFLQGSTPYLEYWEDGPRVHVYSSLADKPFVLRAEALYDNRNTNKWTLSFSRGSIFDLYDVKTNEDGWLLGALAGGGREGFIPEAYVNIIPETAPQNPTWEQILPQEEFERLPKTMEARKVHATEILTTERTYVENLNILNELLNKLRENSMGLDVLDIEAIFPGIETLKVCHEKFLAALEKCLRGWNADSLMGKVFIENVNKKTNIQFSHDFFVRLLKIKFIKLYKHYINGYRDATEAVSRCRLEHKDFRKYLDSVENTPAMLGNKLSDVLITPVQRIPRYVLLLKDMLISTPSTHPDRRFVEEAHTLVREIADYVNRTKQLADNVAELRTLQQKFSGYTGKLDSLPARKFIKDTPLVVNKEKVRMWVFNDIAVMTRREPTHKGVYKYLYSLDFKTSKICRSNETCTLKLFASTTTNAHVMQYDSPEECNDGFTELTELIGGARDLLIGSAYNPNEHYANDGSQAFNDIEALKINKKRTIIFGHICTEDNAYIEKLSAYINGLVIPIRNSAILDAATYRSIFSNFEKLYKKACKINKDINTRFLEWSATSSSVDVFIGHEEDLNFYVRYAACYAEQVSTLGKAKENVEFSNLLHACELSIDCNIDNMFELPMSKLSEYQVALQEMLRSSKGHPEFKSIKNFLKKLRSMNEDVFLKGNSCLNRLPDKVK